MHDESKFTLITSEQRMLFDIRQLLIEINQKLDTNKGTIEPLKVESNQIIPKEENKGENCQYCGGVHENTGAKLACAKKYKKGVK